MYGEAPPWAHAEEQVSLNQWPQPGGTARHPGRGGDLQHSSARPCSGIESLTS